MVARARVPALPASPGFELHVLPSDEPERGPPRARARRPSASSPPGDLYEVNLARRIPLQVRGDALALFASLLEAAPAPWGFLQDLGDNLVSRSQSRARALGARRRAPHLPRQGHAPARRRRRRRTRALARALDADPKERAELTMAVDVHRNDLGRVAVRGQRARARASLASSPGRTVLEPRGRGRRHARARAPRSTDVARAVLPCGSITGAPKVRAMEVIARLEPWRRGAYTGVFGWVGRDGRLELAMAIRTLQWSRRRAGQGAVLHRRRHRGRQRPRARARGDALEGGAARARSERGRRRSFRDYSDGGGVDEPRRSGPRVAGLRARVHRAWQEHADGRRLRRSSARSAPSTATWRRTWRWRSRRRRASRRARSPRRSSKALAGSDVVASAEVAGPGFVNLRLRPAAFHAELDGHPAARDAPGAARRRRRASASTSSS